MEGGVEQVVAGRERAEARRIRRLKLKPCLGAL